MAKLSRPPTIALLAVTFFVVSHSSAAVSGLGGTLGGKTKVKDVKTNQEVQDLGKYSVEKYNQQQQEKKKDNGGDLKFVEVVEAETQVVSGIKYYLKISATAAANGERETFDAEVVVKSWERTKELLKFAPSPSDN